MWLLNPYWYTRQYSAPVSDYLDRVIAADVAAGNLLGLEDATKAAYATFIDNLIVDGYLGVSGGTISQASSLIKASPIMAGARTLAGALVPLVGTAPTRFGTEGGWNYNRKTGLLGNATNNYLNANRNNTAEPQNSRHLALFNTTAFAAKTDGHFPLGAVGNSWIGIGTSAGGDQNRYFLRLSQSSSTSISASASTATGMLGVNRSTASTLEYRFTGTTASASVTSATPTSGDYGVFVNISNLTQFTTARIAFYSIGESLNLALLDARVTALINAFAAAIP